MQHTYLTIGTEAYDCHFTGQVNVFPYSTLLQFSFISITLNGPIST